MARNELRGVIAAVATAVGSDGAPDCKRSVALANYLLANGCDGLNVLGTTGEATSFSVEQRMAVMSAYRAAGLPTQRLMVGTGAAAVPDAITLTRHAATLGFAGALLLPPFYYKGIPDEGLFASVELVLRATAATPIPVYLYNFPAQSGLPWSLDLIRRLLGAFRDRIVGLKDSSGDMGYAREVASIAGDFQVFPSTEAILIEARSGSFAGCISATANLNADLCAKAWRDGDATALQRAVNIRQLFDGKQLVPGVKAVLAHIHDDQHWSRVQPPLQAYSQADRTTVVNAYERLRAHGGEPGRAVNERARAL